VISTGVRWTGLTAAAWLDYRFDEVDWFGLIYDVRGVQGDTDFVRAPAEIHFSEIDHFTSLEMVVKRIENALSRPVGRDARLLQHALRRKEKEAGF
jgi:hypothetical protein